MLLTIDEMMLMENAQLSPGHVSRYHTQSVPAAQLTLSQSSFLFLGSLVEAQQGQFLAPSFVSLKNTFYPSSWV